MIRLNTKSYNMILTEKQQKCHQVKLINMNILRRVIEQAKFTCTALGETLEKQRKIIEDQGKKQIKAIKDHEKQMIEFNELVEERSEFKN